MKTLARAFASRSLVPLLAAALVLGIGATPAWAKKKPVDLTAFEGVYTGPISLTVGNQSLAGTARADVKVPKSGKAATVTFTGSLVVGNDSIPITNTFTFRPGSQFTLAHLLFNVDSDLPGAVGTSTAKKRSIDYSGRFVVGTTTGATFGKVSIRPLKKRQELHFTNVLTVDGESTVYTFDFQLSKKLKPAKD